ncbi:D-tagatose-bisphosphate aldolase, class II, non-catalytic subunit [Lichenicoccus roseus]|uniref:D-tagatose-bisphosphate aldolase, class II, non-catalytic subunit n=1 Tax=Lichenicoccus roseus TaxID=2683649 RepID=A0A5R9J3T9_9PROT|nr:D-tagatose-bisphosphate aldolase, class II, non-catalytic subunit [Lichenicoccus roseus]TLU71639.1 D-tagatose-bisphosphate aldolase, class II, non-catalytic subunit [Lichenicoccus roseus]
MTSPALTRLAAARVQGVPAGLVSICSAHPLVIEAALLQARDDGTEVLIEATCNQVNQEGGYTGMTPAAFRDFVHGIADHVGFARERVVLGGDHLGPNPWKHLPADEAMARAERMIAGYAEAGYVKLHLDASMGCAGEPAALDDTQTAGRAARLAAAAEHAAPGQAVYVIGTEVPTPGGALEALDHLQPTEADAVLATYAVHADAFRDVAKGDAWRRVLAIVVQPGVEFGHENVAVYAPERALALSASLDAMPGLVFEAHSTDYQPEASLRRLVQDGYPILKVGPGLTFALREALYGLDAIDGILHPGHDRLVDTMETVMLAEPKHWRSHYPGTFDEQRLLRHYSYSDRIRYYWPVPAAQAAVDALLGRLGDSPIPETLVSQHLPRLHERVMLGAIPPLARTLLIESVRDVLRIYGRACRPSATPSTKERQA